MEGSWRSKLWIVEGGLSGERGASRNNLFKSFRYWSAVWTEVSYIRPQPFSTAVHARPRAMIDMVFAHVWDRWYTARYRFVKQFSSPGLTTLHFVRDSWSAYGFIVAPYLLCYFSDVKNRLAKRHIRATSRELIMMDYLISYKKKNVLLIAPFKTMDGVHADSYRRRPHSGLIAWKVQPSRYIVRRGGLGKAAAIRRNLVDDGRIKSSLKCCDILSNV